jgi:dienelactone hydrolase
MSITGLRTRAATVSAVLGAVLVAQVALVPTSGDAQSPGDQWLTSPVDDQTFRTYLDFFAYDADVSFDIHIIGVEEQGGIRKEHLSFQSTLGVRVFAKYYRPIAGTQDRPAILLLHGGEAAGKDSRSSQVLADALVRGGFNVLVVDFLYYGERKTGLLNTFTNQEKSQRLYSQPSTYLSWIAQNVKDAGRAFDFLVQERGANPERIGLVGFSRGGQVASIIGGADQRFAVVAMAYAGHFDALETGHRPAACPANYIGRISPRPLLMINGTHDSDYNKEVSVEPLQRLAGEPVIIIWAETDHTVPMPQERAALVDWLLENL